MVRYGICVACCDMAPTLRNFNRLRNLQRQPVPLTGEQERIVSSLVARPDNVRFPNVEMRVRIPAKGKGQGMKMNGGSVYVTVDGHFKPVHVSMKGTGEEGFLEFMLEDVEKALKETEMPVMGMMYYNVPDMGIVPRLREGNNDDYLQRLEKAMDGHGIKLHRYLRLSEVVYCL